MRERAKNHLCYKKHKHIIKTFLTKKVGASSFVPTSHLYHYNLKSSVMVNIIGAWSWRDPVSTTDNSAN